jgi:hypothetical protein
MDYIFGFDKRCRDSRAQFVPPPVSASDTTAILNFISKPGRLVIAGTYTRTETDFLNTVFGSLGVVTGDGALGLSENAAERPSSLWASHSFTNLPNSNAVEGISIVGTTATYSIGYGTTTGTTAVQFKVNGGSVIYLGFDWYEEPTPAEWQEALDLSFR